MAAAIDQLNDSHSDTIEEIIQAVRTGKEYTINPNILSQMQNMVAADLGFDLRQVDSPDSLQGKLLRYLAAQAGDPDLAAAEWMASTAPLGILNPIVPGGAFPLISDETAAKNRNKYAQPDPVKAELGNYKSYEEAQELADQELEKELAKGFLITAPTRKELEHKVGPIHPSRVGVIIKELADRIKVRLIHDLSRSGINQQVKLHERVVLPRLGDLARDISELIKAGGNIKYLLLLVVDF